MKTLLNEISNLPPEQLNWVLTIKEIFKPTIHYGTMDITNLVDSFKSKAYEKEYMDIVTLTKSYDFEEFFKN